MTRRPTLKELAQQIHDDMDNGAPDSRCQDDIRRFLQEALAILARDPYERTKGLYLDVSYTPEQLKQLARRLCEMADEMRARQRRREMEEQSSADWKKTQEILGKE